MGSKSSALLKAIIKSGHDPAVVMLWAVYAGRDPGEMVWDDATREAFADAYRGEYMLLGDWAKEFHEEHYGEHLDALPQAVREAIDWERVAEHMTTDGKTRAVAIDGRFYVFSY